MPQLYYLLEFNDVDGEFTPRIFGIYTEKSVAEARQQKIS